MTLIGSVTSGNLAAAPAAGSGGMSPADIANEVLSWASPDGLILHATQPIMAEALRRSGAGAGTEWGPSLQRVLDNPRSVASFQAGFRAGVFDGAKSLVEGAWGLLTGVAKAAYNLGPVGQLVDAAKQAGVIGDVPGWVPDAGRVTAPAAATAKAIGDYLSAVGHDPAKLGNDIKGWVGRNWDGLKASHAAAAAKGGPAEAEWWGHVLGRATFEVAAIVVPVTKLATVAKAGEALNLAVKAGTVGDLFAAAAKGGKLVELLGAAVKAGKTAELVVEARSAGRLGELVTAAGKTPGGIEALAAKGGVTIDDIDGLVKAGGLSPAAGSTARTTMATAKLHEMLALAPKAKAEADALATRIADEFGGRVATAPLKSQARALEKIMADYGGDASRIKDLARNTIIVSDKDIPAVVAQLRAAGANVKIVAAAADPLGYSGVNATFKTSTGLTAEIQVNSAKMIFAKEGATNARAILGEATYNAIAREVGVEGGRGHVLYEQWRSLPPGSPDAARIETESRAYYAHFR